ncbi:MAG TPA: PAS domain S-box protein [Chloroflexi bacterium]|nr:PAS domain S-box protein [Chloroflexota bacterium]
MTHDWEYILAHLSSGIIIIDAQDEIITLNPAAARILDVHAEEVQGKPCGEVLSSLSPVITRLLTTVQQQHAPITDYETRLKRPDSEPVHLRLTISPLSKNGQSPAGVAIILDDVTERRQLEQQAQEVRDLLEHYLPPHVVEQLLSDPESRRLGGVRREVTILFADIRGFVAFGKRVEPEFQVAVLNRHFSLATEAILAEEGTLDKFMGDCLMAIFNAPLPQPDHTLRAVRAALAIQQAVAQMHERLPPAEQLDFGIGITSGDAVIGNIGSAQIHTYTAIGDIVNLAYLLQSHAQPGQILTNADTFERVKKHIVGRPLAAVQLKGHSQPDPIIELLKLRES